MASVHVLEASGPSVRLVFHIPIPATGNNQVGVQWRNAVRFGIGPFPRASILPIHATNPGSITTAESTQLVNGEIHEHVETVFVEAATNGFLDDLVNNRKAVILAKLQEDLKYFGHTRITP